MPIEIPLPGNDPVNHPRHYNSHPSGLEAIEVTRGMCFDAGNATKYVWRRNDKGTPLQDLDKARWYLEDQLSHFDSYVPHLTSTSDLLIQVANAEQFGSHARTFFLAMAHHDLDEALAAVRSMMNALVGADMMSELEGDA